MGFNNWLFYFSRNIGPAILIVVTYPIFLILYTLDMIADLARILYKSDGSEDLPWPWQMEWPLFDEYEEENK